MMKLEWNEPKVMIENFQPNEYVAACYTLVCAIPGSNPTEIGDGTSSRWFLKNAIPGYKPYTISKMWDGKYVEADGLLHGNCGNESTSYDLTHNIGYEHNNDGTVKNAVISNVSIGSHQSGNVYYATWESNNGNPKNYVHYGYALMDSNQNHS